MLGTGRTRSGLFSLLPLALFLGASAESRAAADGEPWLKMAWSAPAGCPTKDYVLARVDHLLQSSTAPRKPVGVVANVEPGPGGTWRVDIAVTADGAAGHRRLEAESCRAVADATALIVALTIDPTRVGATSPGDAKAGAGTPTPAPPAPSQPPSPPPPRPAPPSPAPPPEGAPAPAESQPTRAAESVAPASSAGTQAATAWVAGVAVGGDTGTLASPVVGGQLWIGWTPGAVRLELAGDLWSASDATAGTGGREGASLQLLGVTVRGAYAFRVGRSVRLGPRLGLAVEHVHADGFGGTVAFRQDVDWAAIQPGAVLAWTFATRFALSFAAEAAIPLVRPVFVVRQPSPLPDTFVHQAARVAGRAFLGLEWHFL